MGVTVGDPSEPSAVQSVRVAGVELTGRVELGPGEFRVFEGAVDVGSDVLVMEWTPVAAKAGSIALIEFERIETKGPARTAGLSRP